MILRTPRLVLREFTAEDWATTHAYQQDPRYLRYYDRDEVTERQTQAFIYSFILWQGEQPRIRTQLAITLAGSGELVGNVGLRREEPDAPMADLGYELSPTHWGRGFATEAARAMVNVVRHVGAAVPHPRALHRRERAQRPRAHAHRPAPRGPPARPSTLQGPVLGRVALRIDARRVDAGGRYEKGDTMSESFYTRSAAFYDAIHEGKAYADESATVHARIQAHLRSNGNALLDVGAGPATTLPTCASTTGWRDWTWRNSCSASRASAIPRPPLPAAT
ncbi:MAG TPA: GNAT family N-acetyltransferase [Longimicrobium sp.]|nr:GNAT family N-acetyltransferase [Longimicrobium sp.]